MLLETLHIVNFRSHKNTTVKFQYGTTVIVGDNGSGKSTIIDAVLFALSGERWEKREGLKLDNFIRWNESGMSVSLLFTADGVKYRVKRGKILNRSTSATLDIMNMDGWKNIASKQRGVDEKLGEILNLNEIDTSVVRQGELTRILKQKPSERKEYFHKLINLEDMEKFHYDFGKYVKDFEDKTNELKGKVENEGNTIKKKDAKLKEITDLKKEKEILEKEMEILEKELVEKKKLCNEEDTKKEICVQISGEISILENNIKNVQSRIGEKEKELNEIEEIEKVIPSLKEEAKNFEELKEKKDKATEILNLKNKYNVFRDKENDYNKHISKISTGQQDENDYTEIYGEIENLKEKIAGLKIYVEEVARLNREENETKKKAADCLKYIKETEEKYFKIFNEKPDLEKINKIPYEKENLQKEIDKLTKEREILKGKEQELNTALKNLEKQKNTLLDEINKEKRNENEIKKKIADCWKYIEETEEKYFKIFNEKGDLEKINKIPEKREILQKEIDKLMKEREILKGKEHELNTALKNFEKQKKELSEAKSVCPVCESPLPDDKKINLLVNVDENKEKTANDLREVQLKINEMDLNKSNKDKQLRDIEDINSELFMARYNEWMDLNTAVEEIKKALLNVENKSHDYENEEKNLKENSDKNKGGINNIEADKSKKESILKSIENINNELFMAKVNEQTELNTITGRIKENKKEVEIKKTEYEKHNDMLIEMTKIFNELKKKHDNYIYSKKFVESTNINGIRESINKILNEIKDMIDINNLPCTIENVEHYITEAKDKLIALEKKKELLNRYEERIKNKDEVARIINKERTNENDLTKKKNELSGKKTDLNYDEKRHNEILKIYEDARKKHQEADKNLCLNDANILTYENILNDIESDLKKIEEAKKEEEILNAFINFSKEIREKFGRNGIQKDISQSFFPILETYTNNLFSTFGFPYDGAEIFEDDENCNINLKKGINTISSASLSGGEKSALSIALNAALSKLIGRADFLILDEPTESLDEGKISELIEILKEFKGVSQLIVISHDRDFKNATRSRIEIYKEKGISHIMGEENENKEFDDEGNESDSNESKEVKNLANTQQGLF